MSISFTYIVANTNDKYEVVDLGFPDPLTTLESIYGNRDWSFDIIFYGEFYSETETGNTETGNTEPLYITDITVTTPDYVLSSSIGNSVTLYKNPAANIFPGEQYRFVNFSSQEESTYVDVTSLPSGLSVIAWDTPTPEDITGSYTFTITYNNPTANSYFQTEIITLDQTLFWDFLPGWTKLQELVANSEK